MQITRITPMTAFGGRQTWVFVRVDTDAGITGVGEASVEGKERAVCGAVEDLARQIIGRDPRRIDQNWQIMYRHGFWRGGIVLNSALSGIEQALWDIAGKDLGVPVHRLARGRQPRSHPPVHTLPGRLCRRPRCPWADPGRPGMVAPSRRDAQARSCSTPNDSGSTPPSRAWRASARQ